MSDNIEIVWQGSSRYELNEQWTQSLKSVKTHSAKGPRLHRQSARDRKRNYMTFVFCLRPCYDKYIISHTHMKQNHNERVKLEKLPASLSGLFDAIDDNLSMKEGNRFYSCLEETLVSAINVPHGGKMMARYQESVAKWLLMTADCLNKAFDVEQTDDLKQFLYKMIGLSPTANGLRQGGDTVRPTDPNLWLSISGEAGKRRSANYQMLDRLTLRVDDETQGYHEKMQGITSQEE